MERYDVRNGEYGFVSVRPDKHGAFCYAEVALDYQRQYRMALYINICLVLFCIFLSAYLVFRKHDPQPVQQAAVSAEEYQAVLQLERQAQAEKATLLRRIEDLGAIRRNLSAQLRTQNANNAKLIAQLEALHVSVPPQPIILEAIRKEAATEKGFRQAVDRAFGNGMGARIKVVNE